jgi:hypothetical protein
MRMVVGWKAAAAGGGGGGRWSGKGEGLCRGGVMRAETKYNGNAVLHDILCTASGAARRLHARWRW